MKKILCLLLSVLMIAGAFSLSAFAAENVAYIAYNGSDDNDGRSAATPKGKLGTISGNGALGMLKNGGTLVVSQKLMIGTNGYNWDVPGAVTITGNYGGVDYKNPEPASNPASGMMKFSSGFTMNVKSDLTIDDIILFQENAQNTIVVKKGGSLTITDKVVCMSAKPYYINIEVEAGGKAVINGGIFSNISGDGDIKIASGVQILSAQSDESPKDGDAGLAFISYTGNDGNTGTSPDSPKKFFGAADGKGVMGMLRSGGTLVVVGKAYIGSANFAFPAMSSPLTITSNYGGVDYKNPEPATNPTCAFKLQSAATLTIESDVIFDDIILFQENAQNTIKVSQGATLIITDKAVLLTKPGNDYHFKIVIEPGATAILSEEAQKVMDIENNGDLIPYVSDDKPADPTPAPKFAASRTYENQFADVTTAHWFHTYVKTAYEYTLANGTSQTKFSPDGKFTVAQALTAAVNIHKAYYGNTVRAAAAGEAWYVPYVEYCVANGIIKAGQFADLNANISRGDMAIVFANILPDSEYAAVRDGSNPDVPDSMACAAAVQKLYRAGIVGGDAGSGNYRPSDAISRAEACVIFTRIAVLDMRAK